MGSVAVAARGELVKSFIFIEEHIPFLLVLVPLSLRRLCFCIVVGGRLGLFLV